MKCSRCQQEKSEDSFYESKHGYHRYCKDCQREYCRMRHFGMSNKYEYYAMRKSEIERELNWINKRMEELS